MVVNTAHDFDVMKFIFLLLILLYSTSGWQELTKTIQLTEYCVTSNESRSNSTCHTLKYYMRNSSLFFKSSTTFIFDAGDHFTDFSVSLQVSNVSGLALIGHNATIQCKNQSNFFHFNYVQDLIIDGLNFFQCGFSLLNKTAGYSTLLLTNVTNFELTNVLISESDYQGIFLNNTFGIIFIANLTIEFCRTFDKQPANAMYFKKCLTNFSANVTIRDTVFLKNVNEGPRKHTYYLGLYPYAAGLTVVMMCPGITVHLDNITAEANVGKDGGNLAFIFHTANLFEVPPVIVNNSNIKDGVATQGGGIFTSLAQPYSAGKQKRSFANHAILFIENTLFENNSASFVGGAISIRQKESNISSYIGDIHIKNCTFIRNSFWNKGGHGGTAITSINFILTEVDQHISPQFKTFVSSCSFVENYIKANKRNSAGTAVIFVKTNPHFNLSDVYINGSNSSGILGLQSNLVLSGNITISNNSAESGGGILLCQNAVLYLESSLDLLIFNNTAQFGGGIAVESVCVVSKPICFFQLVSSSPQDWSNISIHLHNNTALKNTGSNLYGGSVDFCYMIENSAHEAPANLSLPVFKEIFNVLPNYSPGLPYVTSDPNHVCVCINGSVNCSKSDIDYYYPTSVYPGQRFKIRIILVGQLDGSVPGYVVANLQNEDQSGARLDDSSKLHNLKRPQCTEVEYSILSNQTGINVTMEINAAVHDDISVIQFLPQYRQLRVTISISDCPIGFTIADSDVCVCEPILKKVSVNCNTGNQTLVVPTHVWVGNINLSNVSTIVTANHCPPEYCNSSQSYIKASMTNFSQDSQCQSYRTGIMCGQCVDGYSATFGGSGCVKCSNKWLWFLLVDVFAGIFLVFVLTFLNITVADGTINALIFYANVVEAYSSSLFSHTGKDSWLTTTLKLFIGCLSLEIEFQTCFFDGMDEYTKTWISFIFPFYIWLILGLIVLLSRRFVFVMQIIGTNAAKVLATLILLSYSRLLQSIIQAIDFTHVTASNGESWSVWTKDGNMHFFGWKHSLLFVFAVCLLILLIPFTISLLFIQILQRYSHHRIFFLVNKLKPLLDAYTGPYTNSARFWTGYLLFARVLIFICSTLTGRVLYMAGVSIAAALLYILLTTAFFLHEGVYKKNGVQILEGSLLLNLALLLLATSYVGFHKMSQAFYTLFFVGIAFLTFISVILYHVAKQMYKIDLIRNCIFAAKRRVIQRYQYKRIESQEGSTDRGCLPPVVQFIEDREPLLADS